MEEVRGWVVKIPAVEWRDGRAEVLLPAAYWYNLDLDVGFRLRPGSPGEYSFIDPREGVEPDSVPVEKP